MNLRSMVAAELVKTRAVRTTVLVPVVAVGLIVGIAALVALTGSLRPDDTVVGGSVTAGGMLALLVVGAYGARTVAGEFGTGMISASLVACPDRRTLLVSKAVTVAAVAGAAGLLGVITAIGAGHWLLSDSGHAVGSLLPEVLGLAAVFALVACLGLAVGCLVPHPGGAATVVIGVLLAPVLVGPLLGDLQGPVVGVSPYGVMLQLAQSSDAIPEVVGRLGGWQSLAVLAALVVGILVIAAESLERRDV